MTLKLVRNNYCENGVFGELQSETGEHLFYTLEHAYPHDGEYSPKVPDGTYTCQRGQHQLEGMTHPFETFEITNVVGHTNILFHTGNFNKDSAGCVLLGSDLDFPMLTQSRAAFSAFMVYLTGQDTFTLEVL